MTISDTEQKPPPRWRPLYERVAPFLVVFCLVTILVVSVATFALSQAQEQDRRDSDARTATLLKCFDDYAAASSTSSVKVRAATEVRDDAVQARDQAFNVLFQHILTNPPPDDPRGLELFNELAAANSAKTDAQDALDQARADNPIPKPPSSFCDA